MGTRPQGLGVTFFIAWWKLRPYFSRQEAHNFIEPHRRICMFYVSVLGHNHSMYCLAILRQNDYVKQCWLFVSICNQGTKWNRRQSTVIFSHKNVIQNCVANIYLLKHDIRYNKLLGITDSLYMILYYIWRNAEIHGAIGYKECNGLLQ